MGRKNRSTPQELKAESYLWTLEREWSERADSFNKGSVEAADFFIIRAVTVLEVFTRDWVAKFVDHGSPYLENAASTNKNLKFDLDLVRGIEGRTITLGDVIAHNLPINQFPQIIGLFETILNTPLMPLLVNALPYWNFDPENDAKPIVTDVPKMYSNLTRLFEIRHILTHELPGEKVYDIAEIPLFLKATKEFIGAISATAQRMLFGPFRSAMEDRQILYASCQSLENEIEVVIDQLSQRGDDLYGELLKKSQKAWRIFAERQCRLRADFARGGTLSGTLALLEMEEQLTRRLKDLKWYLDRSEYVA